MVHCLFEQSGTFKKAFQNLGIDALDYDLKNDFGETDVQIDLFDEINRAEYNVSSTIFGDLGKDDIVIAFFPCTYFSTQNKLLFSGKSNSFTGWTPQQKLEYVSRRFEDLEYFFSTFCELFLIAYKYKFKLIIENPYWDNFLNLYFPIESSLVINNRTIFGDYFVKPTQFWFVNCVPKFNMIDVILPEDSTQKYVTSEHGIDRSLISYEFAYNFIRRYIL